MDQEANLEQKIGPYARKGDTNKSSMSWSSKQYRKGEKSGNGGGGEGGDNSGNAAGSSSKSGKGGKKSQMSKQEMRKKGICFNCHEAGHIASNCPHSSVRREKAGDERNRRSQLHPPRHATFAKADPDSDSQAKSLRSETR